MRYMLGKTLSAVMVLALATSCATMESRWETAKSKNTITAYEEFIDRYPNSMFSEEEEIRWLREGFDVDGEFPGSLFVMSDGYAVNGKWEDESIEVLDQSEAISIRTADIQSIYRDQTGHAVLYLKNGERHGAIGGDFRIKTLEGGLIVHPKNLALFHSMMKLPAATIQSLFIFGNQDTEIARWKKPPGKNGRIVAGMILPEYYRGKEFSLSNPIYPTKVDGTVPESIQFSFDFHRHSADPAETAIVFFMMGGFRSNYGRTGVYNTTFYNYTPLPSKKGETSTIKIDVPLVDSYGSFSGEGYIQVFVVQKDRVRPSLLNELPKSGFFGSRARGIEVFDTISNVLRLPLEFTR